MKKNNKSLIEKDIQLLDRIGIFYCLDTETTGLSKVDNRIIQVSIIKCSVEQGQIKERKRYSTYVNPGMPHIPLSDKITDLTGITTEKIIQKGIPEEKAWREIKNFMGENPIVVGWNVMFDYRMLDALYGRQLDNFTSLEEIDACKMARYLIPKTEVENYKLQTIAKYYHLDEKVSFHNAEDDTYVTLLLFEEMYQAVKEKEKIKNGTIRPIIYTMNYWAKSFSKKNHIKRIYFQSNIGKFYYDLYTRSFGSDETDISELDLIYLEQFMYWATKTDPETIEKFKGQVIFV